MTWTREKRKSLGIAFSKNSFFRFIHKATTTTTTTTALLLLLLLSRLLPLQPTTSTTNVEAAAATADALIYEGIN